MNVLSSQAKSVSTMLNMLVFLSAAKRSGFKPLSAHVGASPFVCKNKMFFTIAPLWYLVEDRPHSVLYFTTMLTCLQFR